MAQLEASPVPLVPPVPCWIFESGNKRNHKGTETSGSQWFPVRGTGGGNQRGNWSSKEREPEPLVPHAQVTP